MNEQLNPLSHAMDTFHNLCTLTLSGSHELMSWQIDSAEGFIALGTRQLQPLWANSNAMQEPEQWSEAVQLGFRNAIQMTREWVMVTSDCQMAGLHQLRNTLLKHENCFSTHWVSSLLESSWFAPASSATARRQRLALTNTLHKQVRFH